MSLTRRTFIKNSAMSSVALFSGLNLKNTEALALFDDGVDIHQISKKLLLTWLDKLISLQITHTSKSSLYGGIICPDKKIIHGRIGDTIYPMLHMANETKDSKYLDSAKMLYQWMEENVSQSDGSWLNEPLPGSWKGTTVFTVIALAETIKNHGHLLDTQWKNQMEDRLKKAGDFIYKNFTIDYGNINYPINASYGLAILGEILDIQLFKEKGNLFAQRALLAITPEGFISGEGALYHEQSPKGCYAVDLGYNVEESLPALVMYGLLVKNEEFLERLIPVLQTHMEFMLPDGGWDNSWGTRNYKWTYWGSRTSDGCLPAYALMADRDERFYKVAIKNIQLLDSCTHNGLLYGGPHYLSAGILPSVHHTFCHAKALTTILDVKIPPFKKSLNKIVLPRERRERINFYKDIQTLLISNGKFKATLTAYDQQYKHTKGGHASGGALTMLWHEKAGPILCASMDRYQLFEEANMQNSTMASMCLTPRVELNINGELFSNIYDNKSSLQFSHQNSQTLVQTSSKLVNENQKNPDQEEIQCIINYMFERNALTINYKVNANKYNEQVNIVVPIISNSIEEYFYTTSQVRINRENNTVIKLKADVELNVKNRVFNYVPGMEAIPICIKNTSANLKFEVI